MIIGVTGAAKGRGTTSIACALAAALGQLEGETLLIEADTAGGDLASIRGLDAQSHGVVSFAAQSGMNFDVSVYEKSAADSQEATEQALGEHRIGEQVLSALEGHIWRHPDEQVALLPTSALQISLSTQLEALWKDGSADIKAWPHHVVIDLGRWVDNNNHNIWNDCDIGIAVCNGALSDLQRCQQLWDRSPLSNPFATWRVVNGSPWTVHEIEAATGLSFDTILDWDNKAAQAFRQGQWKKVRRRHLSRQILELAKTLCEHDTTSRQILQGTP